MRVFETQTLVVKAQTLQDAADHALRAGFKVAGVLELGCETQWAVRVTRDTRRAVFWFEASRPHGHSVHPDTYPMGSLLWHD